MNTQQVLLRIMLWSLGITAVVGVAAVTFAHGDWARRVIGTGIATAVACALLLPASKLAERETTRAAGILGMSVVVVELIGVLALIWELPRAFGSGRAQDQIAFTLGILAAAAVLAVGVLKAMHGPFGRKPSWAVIGVITATFVCFELYVWRRTLAIPGGDDWIETGWAIFALLGTAVLCCAGNDDYPRRLWNYIGTATSILAWLIVMGGIWNKTDNDFMASVFFCLCAIAASFAHANLAMFSVLKPGQHWVRTTSMVATMIAATVVAIMLVGEKIHFRFASENTLGRIAAAAGIVAACGSLALAVLSRMNARTQFKTETDETARIELFCPRCRTRQSMPPGESKCEECQLRIEIKFEEPRCSECEYLLVGLTGNTCPECGTPIVVLSGSKSATA